MSLFPSLLPSIFHLFAAACYARNRQHRGLGSHMCLTTHSFADVCLVLMASNSVPFWLQNIRVNRCYPKTAGVRRKSRIHKSFCNVSSLERLRLLEELKQALGPQWDKCYLSVQHFDVFLTLKTFCFVLKWQIVKICEDTLCQFALKHNWINCQAIRTLPNPGKNCAWSLALLKFYDRECPFTLYCRVMGLLGIWQILYSGWAEWLIIMQAQEIRWNMNP